MELVYLWVEDYKNIKKQGFNFSPRFEFNYDEDTKKLTKIKDDSETYKSIFPENINVTAIVGENGSGKSALIEEIFNVVSTKIFILFFDKFLYVRKPDSVTLNTTYKYLNLQDFNFYKKTLLLHSDFIKRYEVFDYYDYSNQGIHFSNLYYKILNEKDNLNLNLFHKKFLKLILIYAEKFKLNLFSFNPIDIQINLPKLEFHNKIAFDVNNKDNEDDLLFRMNEVEIIVSELVNEANHSEDLTDKLYVFLLLRYINELKNIEDFNQLGIYEASLYIDHESSHYRIDNFVENIRKYAFYDEILVNGYEGHGRERKIEAYEQICQSLESIVNKNYTLQEFQNIINNLNDEFYTLENLGFFNIDLIDHKKRRFFNLSHGERKFFTDSLLIF